MTNLPEDYDQSKEPVSKYRLRTEAFNEPLSGYSYLVIVLNGETRAGRIKIVADPRNCDHGGTVCGGLTETGSHCVDEWQYDWSLLWSRTEGGRRLLYKLGSKHDKHQNPKHPAARWLANNPV